MSTPGIAPLRSSVDGVTRPVYQSGSVSTSQSESLAYLLFLLVNAALVLRPTDLVPGLQGLPIYQVLILACLILTLRPLCARFTVSAMKSQPITLCVVGILAALILSHLTHMYLGGIREGVVEYSKVVIYYGLIITLVTTPRRWRMFLKTLAVLVTAMVALCLIDYFGWHEFEFIQHVQDRYGVEATGEAHRVARMRGTGIFQDPNDLALLIVAAGVLCTYFVTGRSRGGSRLFWLGALAILIVGLLATKSRGGMLAAGSAAVVLIAIHYGRFWAAALTAVGILGLKALSSRQASFDIEAGGTGHERLMLWREGFEAIKSPDIFFGIGHNMYNDMAGLVAHNSFIHAYVELGLFGGTLFFGCFFFAALSLYRMGKLSDARSELLRFRPFMLAIIAGWCGGIMTLSRCYVPPTDLVLGTAAAYINLVVVMSNGRWRGVEFNGRHLKWLCCASLAWFVILYLVVKILAR